MDNSEVEENLLETGDAKLHGGMCKKISDIVHKVLEIFPILESSRPRSKSGIQALCSLHVALDKTKHLLLHCSSCSKLYLAITGDSILQNFEKARCALRESLKSVTDIVPQAVGRQILCIVSELEDIVFELDEFEKESGEEIILLLQKEKELTGSSNDTEELEIFHKAATRMGITSSRAALTERRALKKLLDKARSEDDKRKESIVAYLLHLMRKYSKLYRTELSDDTELQGSAPSSPTVAGASDGILCTTEKSDPFEKQLSRVSSFTFKPSGLRPRYMPVPPEELRCPISLQLMYDPVVISSGQTYERVCIEKWFNDGHHTCPKTQQQLTHLFLTPNYCVKSLISSWCEQNGVPFPEGPPDSLDLNYWRLALAEPNAIESKQTEVDLGNLKGAKAVPLKENGTIEETDAITLNNSHDNAYKDNENDILEKHQDLLFVFLEGENISEQQAAVEKIRILLRDNEEARSFMGSNGFTEVLVNFLRLAVQKSDKTAQEMGAMALFNLVVNNNKNKEMILSAGVIPLLEEMISSDSYEPATALYLNLTCLEDAKPIIGSSKAVPVLIQLLSPDNENTQCKTDALHTLHNLSSHPSNLSFLVSAGIVKGVSPLISSPIESTWTEKSISILVNLISGSIQTKEDIMSTPDLVSALVAVLDNGEPPEQEQAVSLLLLLCDGDQKVIHTVLKEGVIPALVSASVNGTQRGKEKAQKLLMLFRGHRQRDPSPARLPPLPQSKPEKSTTGDLVAVATTGDLASEATTGNLPAEAETKLLPKSASRRLGRTITAIWKSTHLLHR